VAGQGAPAKGADYGMHPLCNDQRCDNAKPSICTSP